MEAAVKQKAFEALKTVKDVKSVFFYYPDDFKLLPCISYYESGRVAAACADDKEYMTEVIFAVDIWAMTSPEAGEISVKADEALRSVGFFRISEADAYKKGAPAHRTMKYKYNLF